MLVSNFEEIFGKGVRGWVPLSPLGLPAEHMEEPREQTETAEVAVGNRTFMKHLGITIPDELLTERERRVEAGDAGQSSSAGSAAG